MTKPRLLTAVAITVTAALVLGGVATGKTFRIDDIDATRFVDKNEIRFFIDLIDDDGRAIPDVSPDILSVLIDDKPIPGRLEVEPYFETPEAVAVAVIVGANFDYRTYADLLQGPAVKVGLAGAQKLAQRLRPIDRVALWVYDEKDFQRKLSFQEGGPKTGDDIERIELKTYEDEGAEIDPSKTVDLNLYERLLRELGAGIRDEFGRLDTVRRKVIVIMSDGLDSKLEKDPQRISKLVDDIARTASESGIRIYTLGYATIATGGGLAPLRDLSNKTNGVSLLLSDESTRSDIERTWEELAEQIKRQYVVSLYPEDLEGGRRVKFQMKAKVAGAELSTVADRDVHLGEKPFAWKSLLMWIGISIGGLIVLILIYKLIAGYLRRRAERPPEPEVVVVETGPQGPSRGRLQVTKGPMAGEIFFLTEELTTIGRMEGNTLIIDDQSVSRRHAGIKIDDLRYELADLGSTSGVLVNGRKISKQFLKDGDEIRIGNSEMVFLLK